eukprot:TRINITY_DN74670_c0_g1_i1.p1 TRINITY_DN74670_c0_g1~~TRINITY_DN74670_c0_g1_i1.p1  ORF type:complete len:260 (-),score=55.36 TRINITY_DN74670_c0_g1_i1:243-1022(-)
MSTVYGLMPQVCRPPIMKRRRACQACVVGVVIAVVATRLAHYAAVPELGAPASLGRAAWLRTAPAIAAAGSAALGWTSLEEPALALDDDAAMPREKMSRLPERLQKTRTKARNFTVTGSGLQYFDVDPGRGESKVVEVGDTAVMVWEGYTINYFGRPIETRKLSEVSGIQVDPLRFKVGDGTVIKGLDEGVRGMHEEGVRQLIIPVELGYDAAKKLRPRPSTFSGQRALDFVLDNQGGMMDKTLLINVQLKKVYKPGEI